MSDEPPKEVSARTNPQRRAVTLRASAAVAGEFGLCFDAHGGDKHLSGSGWQCGVGGGWGGYMHRLERGVGAV